MAKKPPRAPKYAKPAHPRVADAILALYEIRKQQLALKEQAARLVDEIIASDGGEVGEVRASIYHNRAFRAMRMVTRKEYWGVRLSKVSPPPPAPPATAPLPTPSDGL
jgi:hypothetical protein